MGGRASAPVVTAAATAAARLVLSFVHFQRPAAEVNGLLALFAEYLRAESTECRTRGIRLRVIGRRDRLPLPLRAAIAGAERATAAGRALELRLAIDYSGRDAILAAAERVRMSGPNRLTREQFALHLGGAMHAGRITTDVGLLIRTGGERRLSDFLLWECAYAELVFSDRLWPDFDVADLDLALAEFARRERRFGCVAEKAGS